MKALKCFVALLMSSGLVFGAGQSDSGNAAASPSGQATSESWKQYAKVPVEMEFFGNNAGAEQSDNLMHKLLESDTGVKLTIVGAGTSANEKLNVMIAANDMPDLFWSSFLTQIKGLADEKRLLAIDELSAKYAPDVMKRINPNQRLRTRLLFGSERIYGAPGFGWVPSDQLNNPIVPKNVDTSLLRRDIYEALGSPDYSTPDKLQNLLRQVKAKYPGVTPFQSSYNYWTQGWGIPSPVTLLKPHFGMASVDWIEGPAGYHSFIEDPRFVKLLEWMSVNYNEGLMSPTELSDKAPIPRQKIDKGQVFFIGVNMAARAFAHNDGLRAAGVNGEIVAVKPFILPGEKFLSDTFTGGTTASFTYVSTTTKYPERAISLIDWWMSPYGQAVNAFGPDLTQWQFLADGLPAWSKAGVESELAAKMQTHPRQPQLRINYFSLWRDQVANIYTTRTYDGKWTPQQDIQNRYNEMTNAYYKDFFRQNLPGTALSPDSEEVKITSTLTEYIAPEVVKIIMGKPENVATAHAAMMVRARALGYDKIKAWVNNDMKLKEQLIKKYDF